MAPGSVAPADVEHCFTLHIVSPSAGVPSPLSFFLTPTTYTVGNLKDRIKTTIESRPNCHTQRLIHRGRLLARDDETMLEVFGREPLLSGEAQTLHLVLRDTQIIAAPSTTLDASNVPTHTQPVSLGTPTTGTPPSLQQQQTPAGAENTSAMGGPNIQPAASRAATLLPQFIAQYQQTVNDHQLQLLHNQNDELQHQRHAYMQRIQLLQTQIMRLQNDLLAQHQSLRNIGTELNRNISNAPSPLPGGQPQNRQPVPQQIPLPPNFQPLHAIPPHNMHFAPPPFLGNNAEPHRHVSPFVPPTHPPHMHSHDSPSRTFRQEGVLPNGDRWHMVVNETVTTIPNNFAQPQGARASPVPSSQLARDVQSIIRHNDLLSRGRQGLQPTIPASAPMSRHGSQNHGSSSAFPPESSSSTRHTLGSNPTNNQSLNAESEASTVRPTGNPVLTATPSGSTVGPLPTDGPQNLNTAQGQAASPVVYLLSSSTGPRALLMTGTESFYTPRLSTVRRDPTIPGLETGAGSASPFNQPPLRGPENIGIRNMGPVRHGRVFPPEPRPHVNPNVPQDGVRPRNPPNPALNPPVHPPAANARANDGVVGRILPHIWLLIRLGAFVWFFLSGDSSWYRWITLISVAVVIFLINVGVFNGLAEQVWAPARRHLDGLLPLAPPVAPPAGVPAPNLQPGDNQGAVNIGGPAPAPQDRRGEPTPEAIAARLVQQRRRQDQSWLMAQIRRVEHALLLFMASLVPGVGERHIMARLEQEGAQLEAQRVARENAERAAAEVVAPAVVAEATQAAGVPAEVGGQVEEGASTSALEDDTQVRQRHVPAEQNVEV